MGNRETDKKGPFLVRGRALEHIKAYDMPACEIQLIILFNNSQGRV